MNDEEEIETVDELEEVEEIEELAEPVGEIVEVSPEVYGAWLQEKYWGVYDKLAGQRIK